MSDMVHLTNVSFAYAGRVVLEKLTFGVPGGTFFAVAGPNGAGKTTLLNVLCGILRPGSGSVRIDGVEVDRYSVRALARKVAIVRQEFIPAFEFSVAEFVLMARTPYLKGLAFTGEADRVLAAEALAITDTADFASRSLGELSGGERQRVFIARAIAQDTPVILLDEPTSYLDLKHQVGIYDLLRRMQLEKGKTIIVVTHDINLACQYCDQVLLLAGPQAKRRYYAGPPQEVLTPRRVEEVFGVGMFTGRVKRAGFFLPLGKLARDCDVLQAADR